MKIGKLGAHFVLQSYMFFSDFTLIKTAANRIATISNNFTLGFGSFVDKIRASFISINPERYLNE